MFFELVEPGMNYKIEVKFIFKLYQFYLFVSEKRFYINHIIDILCTHFERPKEMSGLIVSGSSL